MTLATGTRDDVILLEDMNDLVEMAVGRGAVVPCERWVPEIAAMVASEACSRANEGLL